jgi:adenosine deaminase
MLDHDLNISLGSDDPGIMNYTYSEQFLRLYDELNIPDAVLIGLIKNGILNSGLSWEEKREMSKELDRVLATF